MRRILDVGDKDNMLLTISHKSLDDFSGLPLVREAVGGRSDGLLVTGLPEFPATLEGNVVSLVRLSKAPDNRRA